MIYRIREKFWSMGNRFTITDAEEQPVYQVRGKPFSWGSKLSFQDMAGGELAFIDQKLMSWKPRFRIEIHGRLIAEMVREFSWLKQTFTLDIPGPNDYTIDGSFWCHEYQFRRKDREVALVSKKMWCWSDSYGVQIVEGEDDVAILCACIVIDQIIQQETAAAGM